MDLHSMEHPREYHWSSRAATHGLTASLRGALLVAALTWLVGCRTAPTAPSQQPSPTPPAPLGAATLIPAPVPSATPEAPSPGAPTGTAAIVLPGRWQHYPSLNQVHALAFDAVGTLWAGTTTGVVAWDLTTDTAQHHTFGECASAYTACDAQSQWVHDIIAAEDPDGRSSIWAATSSGVQQHIGGTWRSFTQADGLPDALILSIASAPDGTIWVGTGNGLATYDGERWVPHAAMADIEGGTVWAVAVAPDGTVWASTHAGGVVAYAPHEGTWQRFSSESGFPYPSARFLTLDPDGQPWVHIGYDNVYRFDGRSWSLAYAAGGGQWVCDIAFSDAAPLGGTQGASLPLIATCGGFHAYGAGLAFPAIGSWRTLKTGDGLPSDNLTAVAVGPAGEVAVGTSRGIGVYRDGSWRVLREGPTLGTVTTAAVTPDGVAWFGFGDAAFRSAGGGVASFDGTTWRYEDAGGSDGNVRTLAAAPNGGLWAGVGCTVQRRREGQWETVAGCDSVAGNVTAIRFGPAGDAWVTTDFDLYHIVDETITTYESRTPLALAVGPDGTVWMARNPIVGGGLFSFGGSTWITQTAPFDPIHAIAVPSADEVLMAGMGGMARFDGAQWKAIAAPESGTAMLTVGPDGAVWAIGGDAIARRTGEGWETMASFGVPVRTIAFASEEVLWIGTDLGVLRYEP